MLSLSLAPECNSRYENYLIKSGMLKCILLLVIIYIHIYIFLLIIKFFNLKVSALCNVTFPLWDTPNCEGTTILKEILCKWPRRIRTDCNELFFFFPKAEKIKNMLKSFL